MNLDAHRRRLLGDPVGWIVEHDVRGPTESESRAMIVDEPVTTRAHSERNRRAAVSATCALNVTY